MLKLYFGYIYLVTNEFRNFILRKMLMYIFWKIMLTCSGVYDD